MISLAFLEAMKTSYIEGAALSLKNNPDPESQTILKYLREGNMGFKFVYKSKTTLKTLEMIISAEMLK